MAVAGAKVFVVDDDAAARDAMQELMESVGLDVRTFASATEFLEVYDSQWRGCVLLDVRMPGMSGLQLQEEMRRRGSHLPLIFVTAHGDIPMAVEALKKGAADFVEKPFGGQTLLDKVHEALCLEERNFLRHTQVEEVRSRLALLTPKEKQVLQRLVEGQRSKQMALALGLSRKTVDWHLSVIREKMGADSTGDLMLLLHKAGCLDAEGALPPTTRF
ncbi:response regulator transcription factor [Anaerobaca lacustris]|uniref:Response regulator n=1 Tax=Anaerobaca lacustris TaxID=3044600 RepID=A0AAW6U658_9BACT|nr:response regulator [Sedimentisphaerales bacterium M17dextr]